jgi:hypothetical protein
MVDGVWCAVSCWGECASDACFVACAVALRAVCMSPPTPPTVRRPCRLLRFDVSSLDCEKEIRSVHHDGGVTAMACSPHGQFLLTGGGDQTIKVCSLLRVRMGSRVRMCVCARAYACVLARCVCVPCKCMCEHASARVRMRACACARTRMHANMRGCICARTCMHASMRACARGCLSLRMPICECVVVGVSVCAMCGTRSQ